MTMASQTTGIDVSHHQDSIDWTKVRAAGHRFAFIKATEGATVTDALFATNWKAARDAGLRTGAYHFFHPQTDVAKQVENFLAAVGSRRSGDLPPVLDLEVPSEWIVAPEFDQWSKVPASERVPRVLAWLKAVEARLGVRPIIYLSPSFANDILANDARLAAYDLWIAHYTSASSPTVPKPWTTWLYWQFSETGTAPGIPGKSVDLDVFNGTMLQENDQIAPASDSLMMRFFRAIKRMWQAIFA